MLLGSNEAILGTRKKKTVLVIFIMRQTEVSTKNFCFADVII